jgi:hypothetical protein
MSFAFETLDGTMLIAVDLEREHEQIRQVLAILQEVGVPAELISDASGIPGPSSTVFRVARDRMEAAVLALTRHGFRNIRAYEIPDD